MKVLKHTWKSLLKPQSQGKMASINRPSSNLAEFRKILADCQNVVVLSGAGISAESGIPTFRGAGGFWRRWQATQLATPEAFEANPSLVWEFYHHRREVVLTKQPNAAHYAVAKFQENQRSINRNVTVITQNIDELHTVAGAKEVIELHGSLFKVRCTKCHAVEVNRDSPICAALHGKGEPDVNSKDAQIPVNKLPACKKCGKLARPHVVWFGESLDKEVLEKAENAVGKCDLLLVIGTSSVVYPAAAFAPDARMRGIPIAEFNLEDTVKTEQFNFQFKGPSGEWLPKALAWPFYN